MTRHRRDRRLRDRVSTLPPALTAVVGALAILLLVAGLAGALGWVRYFIVATPSMGEAAPVGTLVVTRSVDRVGSPVVGDVITFRPPGIERDYTHRVVEVSSAGYRTKGDLNGAADGWVVPPDRVEGRAVAILRGVGWMVRCLPWVLGGLVATSVVRRFVRRETRAATTIVGASLSVALALIVVRPLVRAETLGFRAMDVGSVRMSAVGTGLLPLRVTTLDGNYGDIRPGQAVWLDTHTQDASGRFVLTPALHLPWWGWAIVALVCATPLLVSSWIVARERRRERRTPARRLPVPASRLGLAAATALGLVVVVGIPIALTTSALSASVTNTTDTARSRRFATCLDAMRYFNSDAGPYGELFVGYTFGPDDTTTGSENQSAFSGSGANAILTNTTTTTNVGCQSDAAVRHQKAVTLNGTSKLDTNASGMGNGYPDPTDLNQTTWQVWFRTTTTSGGVLSCPGGVADACHDRVTWMDDTGHVNFGVGSTVLTSTAKLNDGAWHLVIAQVDNQVGTTLWIDGVRDKSDAGLKSGQAIVGYPQFGYASGMDATLRGLRPMTSLYFTGDLQMGAVYGAPWNAGQTLQIRDAEVSAIYESAMP